MTKPKFELKVQPPKQPVPHMIYHCPPLTHVKRTVLFADVGDRPPESLKKGVYIPLQKAQPVQDSDGVLTSFGMQIAQQYATSWLNNVRNVELERLYPELEGFFYDIRSDAELARTHAEEG